MKKRLLLLPVLLLALLLTACAAAGGMPEDGQYTIDVTLTGGSGRASVESPAALTVQDGIATATIVWSSPYYEWMEIGGVSYEPIQESGNSTFSIPVELDTDIEISAQTVAMSEPHVISYTLRFDSSTVKQAR